MRRVTEVLDGGDVPLWRHPEWQTRFPWLQQGTTGSQNGSEGDFALFGELPVREVVGRWRALRAAAQMRTAVHARQVHGAGVAEWTEPLPSALVLADAFDAHVTAIPAVLLTVSVADCVPVFLVSEAPRVLALIHAGWRGTAAGVLERGIEAAERSGAAARDLWLHCGPAICGDCYEVGPEVHAALDADSPVPDRPTPIDLSRALCDRAARADLSPQRMTISAHCTLCGPGGFFSHRGGSAGRQLGVLGYLD